MFCSCARALELNWSNANVKNASRRTLIGKIMTKKKLNNLAVKSMILKGWNPKKEVMIMDEVDDTFLFSFESAEDRERILRDRSWLIMGFLLLIQEREEYVPICEVQWRRSLYWIQVHGIPIEGFTEENIVKIRSRIGDVEEFEMSIVNGVVVRRFLPIRVWIEVNKTLIDGFWLSRPGLGRCYISERYEKLQIFCFNCGVISHDCWNCDAEKLMSTVDQKVQKFGG